MGRWGGEVRVWGLFENQWGVVQTVHMGLWASPWVLPPSMAHGNVPGNRLPMGQAPHLSSVLSKQSIWANTSAISSFSFCGYTYKGQPGSPTLLVVRALPSAFSAPPLSCALLSSKQELNTSVCSWPASALISGVGVPVHTPDPIFSLLSLPVWPESLLPVVPTNRPSLHLANSSP